MEGGGDLDKIYNIHPCILYTTEIVFKTKIRQFKMDKDKRNSNLILPSDKS